ncbi:MAG: SOS response-associated peptidase family protein [Gammaproteobacteria bacterium]|jgi:putative SOS response-associated peptidase YedK|nr:DUF159 family protein [Chromatiales bacterium]MDP6674656.1 SOS response-associated peptidase family protein [Gammaproteobacteria bacterium]
MCTNFALIKTDGTAELGHNLLVDAGNFIYSSDFRPGSRVSIITGDEGQRQVLPAIWGLYLRQTEAGLKPHRDYFSVNTNYQKLAKKTEYRRSRCIIPATSFVESQNGKCPHLLEPKNGSAIAFGGLFKEWTDRATGEIVYSASIITLPGHPALESIHRKSTPLWLPGEAYDRWLSPDVTDTTLFEELLTPALQTDLIATPVNKASAKQPIAVPFTIAV